MGTTADKLTYLNETKQELKQAINNLGGDITSQTTFRNYVSQLDGVYDNLPKTSFQEGTEVTIEGGLKGKIDFDDGKVGFGQASQDTTNGYQLIHQASFGTFTDNGITFTQLADGGIKVNGTASADADVNLLTGNKSVANNDNNILIEANQNYVFSGNPNGDVNTISLVMHTKSYGNVVRGIGNPNVFSFTADVDMSAVRIIVKSGVTINNMILYPMLEKGSTAHDFEQYTGGYASPNPSYPQEIEVVRGKNRLKLENGTTTMHNVTSVTENGKITLNGTPNSTDYISLIGTYVANTTDTFTLTPFKSATNSDIRLLYTINDGSLVNSDNTPQISLTRGDILKVYLRISSTSQITNFTLQPQLEKGSQATSYLPYNTIEEVVGGKNKLNFSDVTLESNGITLQIKDNYFILNGTNNGTESAWNISYYMTPFKTNANTKLKAFQISGTSSGTSQNTLLRTYYNWQEQVNVNFKGTTISSYSEELTYNQSIFSLTGGTYNDYKIAFMVADNLTDSDTFEPYVIPRTYQFSLGNNKFYSIGDYADELLYDVENDKVYKNEKIGKYTFTGNENITLATHVGNMYAFRYDDLSNNYIGRDENQYLCTNYKQKLLADWDNEGIINVSTSVPYIYIFTTGDTASNTTAFKTWLANNKPLLYYRLETPTLTELTDTALKQQVKNWYYSQSFTGTTIIESNGDLPMIIKVRALKGE